MTEIRARSADSQDSHVGSQTQPFLPRPHRLAVESSRQARTAAGASGHSRCRPSAGDGATVAGAVVRDRRRDVPRTVWRCGHRGLVAGRQAGARRLASPTRSSSEHRLQRSHAEGGRLIDLVSPDRMQLAARQTPIADAWWLAALRRPGGHRPIAPRAHAACRRTPGSLSFRATSRPCAARASPIAPSAQAACWRTSLLLSRRAPISPSTAAL